MGREKGVSGHTHSQQDLDHYANQSNPNHSAHQATWDNHSNQLNPNNDEYKGSPEEKEK